MDVKFLWVQRECTYGLETQLSHLYSDTFFFYLDLVLNWGGKRKEKYYASSVAMTTLCNTVLETLLQRRAEPHGHLLFKYEKGGSEKKS